ncbi:penicillin-binding protein 2 [Carboxydothermus hydrogenoformans]|nr:penicillin-binding protein 2 [Carboxydothermus hydrogenoformans]
MRKNIKANLGWMGVVVTFFLFILWGRLFYLQVYATAKYQTLARKNAIRIIDVKAPRGEILDRNGKKIVTNKAVYTVSLLFTGLKNADVILPKLAQILQVSEEELRLKIKNSKARPYEPIRLATDVPWEVVAKIEERRYELPGVTVSIEPARDYPYGNLLAHVVGYIQEIKDTQLKEHQAEGYKLGDMFGQTGLESFYESVLRGKNGGREIEVDAKGNPVRDLGIKTRPEQGNSLVLTIDVDLQKAAEESLKKTIAALQNRYPDARAGAVVALDVRSGEVLAMASYPTFDPAAFPKGLTQKQVDEYIRNPDRPLYNRAVSATYPPGSTFKMVTGMAALLNRVTTPSETIFDPGYYKLGNRAFKDWNPRGHGVVNFVKAIKESCNVYFWTMARRLGVEKIVEVGKQFGLGMMTGIDLPGESSGLLPTPEWKKETNTAIIEKNLKPKIDKIKSDYEQRIARAKTSEEKKRLEAERDKKIQAINRQIEIYRWETEWQQYDTLNMAIGQGYNNYTLLQLANYVAMIANGGIRYQPHLVKKVLDNRGKVIEEVKPRVLSKAKIPENILNYVRQGMREVTMPGGTAGGVFAGFPVAVAAKTGTAQVFGKDDHGLFVAYAPFENPRIAVAAIIEHGGHGGSSAGLVARDVLAAYFKVPKVNTRVFGPVE